MLIELKCRSVGGQVGWTFTCSYIGCEFNSNSGQTSDPNNFLKIGAVIFVSFVTIEYVDAK